MKKSLGAKLASVRKDKKLTQAELAEKISRRGFKVTNKAVSNWEKDVYEPGIMQFLALCDVLEVDDILWQFAGKHSGILAGLNAEGRQKVREFADIVFHVDKFRDEPETAANQGEARLLKLYSIPVSAGTGSFLDESDYELIEAPDYVPQSADFALRIRGDSMEPLYRDKQIIWIKRQDALLAGDIGIFFYDDETFCKKFTDRGDRVVMESANSEYQDIEIDGSKVFEIIGKVVS